MSYYNLAELGDLERTLFTQKHNPCIFISHKKNTMLHIIYLIFVYLFKSS